MHPRQSDASNKASRQEVVQNERSKASASHFIIERRGFKPAEWMFQVDLEDRLSRYDGVIGEAEVDAVDAYWGCVGADIGPYALTASCCRSTEDVDVSYADAVWEAGL
jgi:hypothetical protein